jgi:O-antigen ligase
MIRMDSRPKVYRSAQLSGPAVRKVDALQRFFWAGLVVSFPFTGMSLYPKVLKTFGQPAVLLVGVLGALVLTEALVRPNKLFVPKGRSAMLVFAFLVIVSLSFFLSYPINPYMWPGHSPWSKSAKQLAQWLVDGSVVYFTVRFVQSWRDFRRTLMYSFIGFLLATGSAVIEIVAMHSPDGSAQTLLEILHNGVWAHQGNRLSLLAYEPSMAGDYLLSVVPLLVCGSFYWKSKIWTAVWSLIAILLFCGTFSFGCFGALFVASLVVGIVYARRGSKGLIAGVLVLLLVVVTATVSSSKGEEFLGGRISDILESGLDPSNISNFSTRQRLAGAEAAFNIFLDHPLTGVGVGKSPFYMYRAYPTWALNQVDLVGSTFNQGSDPSEATFGSYDPSSAICFNLFIQILAEMGIGGIIIFVALLVSMLADCYGAMNIAKERWKRKVFAGVLFALVAQIIHYNAMSWLGMRYWFFIWGLAICAPRLLSQKDPEICGRGEVAIKMAMSRPRFM